MTLVWQWPQLTFCALMLVLAATDITRDAITTRHGVAASVFGNAVVWGRLVTLLYFGGFFTEVRP